MGERTDNPTVRRRPHLLSLLLDSTLQLLGQTKGESRREFARCIDGFDRRSRTDETHVITSEPEGEIPAVAFGIRFGDEPVKGFHQPRAQRWSHGITQTVSEFFNLRSA
jgi:hypothetical protein